MLQLGVGPDCKTAGAGGGRRGGWQGSQLQPSRQMQPSGRQAGRQVRALGVAMAALPLSQLRAGAWLTPPPPRPPRPRLCRDNEKFNEDVHKILAKTVSCSPTLPPGGPLALLDPALAWQVRGRGGSPHLPAQAPAGRRARRPPWAALDHLPSTTCPRLLGGSTTCASPTCPPASPAAGLRAHPARSGAASVCRLPAPTNLGCGCARGGAKPAALRPLPGLPSSCAWPRPAPTPPLPPLGSAPAQTAHHPPLPARCPPGARGHDQHPHHHRGPE